MSSVLDSEGLFEWTEGRHDFLRKEDDGRYIAVTDDVIYNPNFSEPALGSMTPEFMGALEANTVAVLDLEEEEGYFHKDISKNASDYFIGNLYRNFPENNPEYKGEEKDPRKFNYEARNNISWRSAIASVWNEQKGEKVRDITRSPMDSSTYKGATEPM